MSQIIRVPRGSRATGAALGVLLFAGLPATADALQPLPTPGPSPWITPGPTTGPSPVPWPTGTPVPKPTPQPPVTPTPTPAPATAIPLPTPTTTAPASYVCTVPIIGETPVAATVGTTLPAEIATGASTSGDLLLTGAFGGDWGALIDVLGAGGGAVTGGGVNVTVGRLVVTATLRRADGSTVTQTGPVDLDLASFATDTGQFEMSGRLPAFSFRSPGTVTLSVGPPALAFKLTPVGGGPAIALGSTTDSDRDPETFEVPCDGAPTDFSLTVVGDDLGPVPTAIPEPTNLPTPTPTPPAPPTPVGTPTPTPAVPPTPLPTPPPPATLVARGTTAFGSLTSGVLPLSGTLSSIDRVPFGSFSGDLALNPVTARLKVVRLIPITANVNFVPTERLSGTIDDTDRFNGTLKETIRLTKVTALGIPLNVGSSCQTRSPSTIPLSGPFNRIVGGTLSGTFAIAGLSNCGALTSLLSGAVASRSNAIRLTLQP